MLEDEVAFRMEDILGQDFVRDGFEAFQGIGRIREDEVEFFGADGRLRAL